MSEQEKNQELADIICRLFEWNGRQFEAGECVALLNGKVVSVDKCLSEALKVLRHLEPDVTRGMVIEVAEPVTDIIRR